MDRITSLQEHEATKTNLKVEDGKIYICTNNSENFSGSTESWKLVVPASLTHDLIKNAHNPPSAAHQGIAKTLNLLQRYFHWSGMAKQVKNYINQCEICKSTKAVNFSTRPERGGFVEVFQPFQFLYMDFLGPYPRTRNGFTHISVVLDKYSRFPIIEAIRSATAVKVIQILSRIFQTFGVPETIFSDNGKQFQSNMVASFLKQHGVTHRFTAKYSPQANSSERVNRSLLSAIRAYVSDDHQCWDEKLDEISGALQNTSHSSTGCSPHYVVFGRHKITHGSTYNLLRKLNCLGDPEARISSSNQLSIAQEIVLQHLRAANDRHATKYNLRGRPRTFTPGQIIFVRNFTLSDASKQHSTKLAPKFMKAVVRKRIGNVAYEVALENGKSLGIYHAKDIRG